MRHHDSTPYLIKARYAAVCHCGQEIKRGDECLYYPASRKIECRDCATPTLDALADERMMGG
jgi:hypothetical protein